LKKFDGIIEAARYQDGRILLVRAFERRGATWSDRVLLRRDELLDRLKNGKKFATGHRIEFMAGTFETGAAVQAVGQDGQELLSTSPDAQKDELEGVPLF
jgi:hypothetical protein